MFLEWFSIMPIISSGVKVVSLSCLKRTVPGKRKANLSKVFNIHNYTLIKYLLWSDDYSNEWKQLKIVKPVGGLYGRLSSFRICSLTQHAVTTVWIEDFIWLKINQILHFRICYGRDRLLPFKNFISTLSTDQITIHSWSKISEL